MISDSSQLISDSDSDEEELTNSSPLESSNAWMSSMAFLLLRAQYNGFILIYQNVRSKEDLTGHQLEFIGRI